MKQDLYGVAMRRGAALLVIAVCWFGAGLSLSYAGREDGTEPATACGNLERGAVVALSSRAARTLSFAEECALKPKDDFKECDLCPEMVVVPAGSFEMGASDVEIAQLLASERHKRLRLSTRPDDELPRHEVRFAKSFAVGRFVVTFEEWDACVSQGGCRYTPSDSGWGRGRQPVLDVSWDDAQAYVAWLSRRTGRRYRLLSEAEWEYVARAGTTTPYWWGDSISNRQANFGVRYLNEGRAVPVDSFDPNPWGLYQLYGNVTQWVEDCWNASYDGAPSDGSAWISGQCSSRVLRGGSWFSQPESLRSASRSHVHAGSRFVDRSFRVARALGPTPAMAVPAKSADAVQKETVAPGPNGTDACLPARSSGMVPISLRTAQPLSRSEECALEPKESFRECKACPEMVVAPTGSFLMGAPDRERALPFGEQAVRTISPRQDWPQHEVKLERLFAVGRFSVTFEEWDACVEDGGCGGYRPPDLGWGRGRQPVINVSWEDAKAYVSWLSRKTGKPYRLLSEAEREYVTRAGTTTPYWWGRSIVDEQASFNGSDATGLLVVPRKPMPVDSFEPNPWGLYQVHGNVWDWVEDCWDDREPHAPSDGSARTNDQCAQRILRGGSWRDATYFLFSGRRYIGVFAMRSDHIGFRVARTIGR